ncbi:MAG: choice-of-anchor D domain-containing protein [Gammaproteobacteria bacterium]
MSNFSESALKLDPANGLRLIDWFTPGNWSALDLADHDLSGSGPLLLPGTNLLAGGGKAGVLYVLDTDKLGGFDASDSQIVQKEQISVGAIRGGPVYWQRSAANGGPLLYNWGQKDGVKAYAFNGTALAVNPSTQRSGNQIFPGAILALSANGEQHGSGVLWATIAASGDAAENPPVPGELHAFDAEDVSHELWSSAINATRDGYGNLAKYVPPLIANGRVYMATWSNQVAVYGLLSAFKLSATSLSFGAQTTTAASAPMSLTVTNTGVVSLPIASIALSTTGQSPFSQTSNCGTSVAVGAGCTISVVFDPASSGSASATLSINTSGGAGTQTVSLSGTGVVPSYAVSPTSLTFGSQPMNVASAPMSIKVTNTGSVALPIASVALSTASASPFSQTNNCGASVGIGAGCTISVVFDPISAGPATVTLSVKAGGTTSAIDLSGSGSYTVGLKASASSVSAGVPVTLTWSSTPGATCTASGGNSGDNWSGNVNASGSESVTEASSGNYNYALNCVAQGVSATASISVAVTLPTVTMSAAPASVSVGQSVALNWASQNAATSVASGGQPGDGWAKAASTTGTETVTPSAAGTITYTMTCSSGPDSTQASAQVLASAPVVTTTAPASRGGGGGAFDEMSLLALLTMIGLRRRRKLRARATCCTPGRGDLNRPPMPLGCGVSRAICSRSRRTMWSDSPRSQETYLS